MLFLSNYWKQLFIGGVIIAIIGIIGYKDFEINSLEKDLIISRLETTQYKQALAFQNDQIIKNKSDYDEAIKKLPSAIKMIDTKYVTRYQTIYTWRDNNETDNCSNSIQYLNNFQF